MALCQNQTIVVVRNMEVQDCCKHVYHMQRVQKVPLSEILFQINAGMNKRGGFSCIRKFHVFPDNRGKIVAVGKEINILITNPYRVVPNFKSVA